MAESKEAVALELLDRIAQAEGKATGKVFDYSRADKDWVLNTYAACLDTVSDPSNRLG